MFVFGSLIGNLKFFETLEDFKNWFRETKPVLNGMCGLCRIIGRDSRLLYYPAFEYHVQYLVNHEGSSIFKSDQDEKRWTRKGESPSSEELMDLSEDELLEEIVKQEDDYRKKLAVILLNKSNSYDVFSGIDNLTSRFIGVRKFFDKDYTIKIKWNVKDEVRAKREDIVNLLKERLPDEVEVHISGHHVEFH